jgi:hypothetical protein
MAYRSCILIAFLGFIACGDDGGGGGTHDDASTNSDGTQGTSDGATTDSPGGTADAGVGASCGTSVCTSTEECCVSGGGGGTCVAKGTCSGVAFVCDGPEDCSSTEVCCYGNEGGGGAGMGGSECKPTNQCQINACHADADCSGVTSKCCAIANTPYNVCLAQCPMM